MQRRFRISPAVVAALLTLTFLVAACSSKKSNPMSPAGGTGSTFDSGPLTAPATFDHVFPTAGTVTYHCNFHVSLGMVGSVTVANGGVDAVTDTAAGTRFSPSTVTIRPGGTVHWIIASGTHTVTSDTPTSGGGGGGGGGGYHLGRSGG